MAEKATLILQLKDLFSSGAKRASKALGGFNRDLSRADTSLRRFGRRQTRTSVSTGDFVEGQRQAARSLGMTIGKLYLGVQAFQLLGRVAMGFVGAAAETAVFDDRMVMAFDRLSHDGEKTYGHVKRLAEQYGLQVDETAKSYKNFLALQFKPAMADKLIAIGADMQALGADAEEVQGIFRALGQIKAKGKVQAEEMLQLSERGVSQELIYDALGQQLGKSRDEIMSMQQAGKISADDFFVAFETAINKKLGQAQVGESGKEFADKSLAGIFGKMKAKGTNIWKELVKGARPILTEALGGLSKKLDQFAMSPAGAKTFAMIGGIVKGVASAFAYLAPLAIDFFGAMIEGGSETFGALSSVFGQDGNGASLGGLAQMLPELGRLFGNVFGAAVFILGEVGKTGIILGGVISGMAMGIRDFGSWFVSSIGDAILWWDDFKARVMAFDFKGFFLQAGKDIVLGIVNGITAMGGMPIQAVTGLAARMLQAAKDTLGIASPSKEFEKLGMYSGEGFTMGLDSSMTPANDVIPEFMTESARSAGRSDFSGVGGGGAINIQLNVKVFTAATDPQETGKAVAEEVNAAMEDFFLQLADESAA